MERSKYESFYAETTRIYVGIKRRQTRLKLRLMTSDEIQSRKALVHTKTCGGVQKGRDKKTILLMMFSKKILMEIFALTLKYLSTLVIKMIQSKSLYRIDFTRN